MTGVNKFFIYWMERHNLRPGRHFQQRNRPGKPPGNISAGHLERVEMKRSLIIMHHKQMAIIQNLRESHGMFRV